MPSILLPLNSGRVEMPLPLGELNSEGIERPRAESLLGGRVELGGGGG